MDAAIAPSTASSSTGTPAGPSSAVASATAGTRGAAGAGGTAGAEDAAASAAKAGRTGGGAIDTGEGLVAEAADKGSVPAGASLASSEAASDRTGTAIR